MTWATDVKPGNEIALESRYGTSLTRAVVERVTATQVVLAGNRFRLRRSDGEEIGCDTFFRRRGLALTPEVSARLRKCEAMAFAEQAPKLIGRLSVEQIEQVRTLVGRLAAENAAAKDAS